MASCHYRGCERIPSIPVELRFPNSGNVNLKKGGTIYFCDKHYETIKFFMGIKEGKEK